VTKFIKFPKGTVIAAKYRATGDTHNFTCAHDPRSEKYGFVGSRGQYGQIRSAEWMDERFDFIGKVGTN
jgi:hypothetical protein